jgi:hypothetical protein
MKPSAFSPPVIFSAVWWWEQEEQEQVEEEEELPSGLEDLEARMASGPHAGSKALERLRSSLPA